MSQAMASIIASLLRIARRHCQRYGEAEDLLQEALVEAVAVGRGDLSQPDNLRWIKGVLRNMAAEAARSETRRAAREDAYARHAEQTADTDYPDAVPLERLPQAQRVVAKLALSGHTRAEIAHLLGISDAALRQRIAALRSRLSAEDTSAPHEFVGLQAPVAFGQIRRWLHNAMQRQNAQLGTHDQDGHLMMVSIASACSQNRDRRQYIHDDNPLLEKDAPS